MSSKDLDARGGPQKWHNMGTLVSNWFDPKVTELLKKVGAFLRHYGPAWLPRAGGWLLWAAVIIVGLFTLLELFIRVRKALREFLPGLTEAERKRNEQRRRFCELIERRMADLNRSVEWSDDTYTDLEAEVEIEGQAGRLPFPFSLRARDGIRRDSSLAHAIRSTRERRPVMLEGPAGSGKTVALRHVALKLARAAGSSRSNVRPIAVYVNLKTLNRAADEPIDPALIEKHARRYTNDLGYQDVDPFFTQELARGRDEGSMIFLFDSFDEIPEILSATDANDSIRAYGNAIEGFVGGLGRARAVVASRPFRGPKRLGWPIFRVLPLTPKRQIEFIRTTRLGAHTEAQLLGDLPNARLELQPLPRTLSS